MQTIAIRQTVSVGSRFTKTGLPAAAPTIADGVATYEASATGGRYVFSNKDTGLPPKSGDSVTARNGAATRGISIQGNAGDATSVKVWIGPPDMLVCADTLTPTADGSFIWEQPLTLLPDCEVCLEDLGGGVTAIRWAAIARGDLIVGAA